MNFRDIFEKIDSLYDRYVQVWEDVCNIESPTSHKAGVDAVSNYFIRMAEERGWKVEVCEQAVAGNAVCITMNPDAAGMPVSISGHMDTVHAVGSFGTPAVHRDAEKIYGPGVCDCKGGIVMGFLAMDALHQCGFRDRPVHLLLQSDEEVGSGISKKETIRFICEKAKDSVAFLNLEGSTPGEICLVRKGISNFIFTVTGKEAHSSKCATEGANAILEAAHKIIELEKIKDVDGLTCCCSVIEGGTLSNIVPGKCTFKANVRFANAEQLNWMREYTQKLAAQVFVPGCTTEVNKPGCRVAMEYCERNVQLLDKMNDIWETCGMSRCAMSKGTGGSDAAYVTAAGIPCVDNMGAWGGNNHSFDEFAYLSSLGEATKRIAAVLMNI
ncbi:MAG: M20 family metallopeptidase [Ruminococcaceae bacterium]|nr:M20 family metallopeptidase [Oscillospiraceae bacterium]